MDQDETPSAFEIPAAVVGLINQIFPPILAEQTHRARLEAATRIAAAILSNPSIPPLNESYQDMAAAYAVAIVEVIEAKLLPSPPPAGMQEGQGGER